MIKHKYFKRILTGSLVGTEALESHISVELIGETCLIELEGAPPVVYFNEKYPRLNTVVEDIRQIQFNRSTRRANKGMKSILFGGVNRQITKMGFALKERYCPKTQN